MKNLYVCEYPYVMYKILIKVMLSQDNKNDLIISDRILGMTEMCAALENSHLFESVKIYHYDPEDPYHNMKIKRSKNPFINLFYFYKRYIGATTHQKLLDNDDFLNNIDFSQYDNIYTTDFDVSRINGYLARKKYKYILMEHAKYVLNKDNIGLIYNFTTLIALLLDKVNLITGIRIASKYCEKIEVHDSTNLGWCLRFKNIIEWNVEENCNRLSPEDKNRLFCIYAQAYDFSYNDKVEYNLLLTNPLYKDNLVDSLEKQKDFFVRVVELYLNDGRILMIKPHPRDNLDYKSIFDNAIIVPPGISSEILVFGSDLKLNCALTYYSTSIGIFDGIAEKVIQIERNEQDARKNINDFLKKK